MSKTLGKSFDELIDNIVDIEEERIQEIPIELIKPNKYQPRSTFDEEEITLLSESIKENGLLQPIVVRKVGDAYELIAGERRLKACQKIGKKFIEAKVLNIKEQEHLTLALIENIQRVDLNPIEKATAFKRLMEINGLTHEEIAKKVGLERSTVSNFIRLLELPDKIKEYVSRGTISFGHAKVLLSIKDAEKQIFLAEKIINDGLSVREVEKMCSKRQRKTLKKSIVESDNKIFLNDVESKIRNKLGTRVKIIQKDNKEGKIIIDFFDTDDLNRILNILMGE